MVAYRIVKQNPNTGERGFIEFRDDDGEGSSLFCDHSPFAGGAGDKMLYVLQAKKAENLMVVVSRWYGTSSYLIRRSRLGGIQLGQMRFKHISDLTAEILAKFREHEEEERKGASNVCITLGAN